MGGIYFSGRAVASIIGAILYSINFKLPIMLSIFTGILVIFVLFLIKEPPFHKSTNTSFRQIKEGFGFLISNKDIKSISIVFTIMSATAYILSNFYQPVLNLTGLPVLYFGLIYLAINSFSSFGALSYEKLKNKLGNDKILSFYLIVVILCSIAFMFNNLILIIFFIMSLSFTFGSHFIYISNLINKIVPSSHRATAISIQNQIILLLFSIIMLVISKISNDYSIFYGMLISLTIALTTLVVFSFTKISTNKSNLKK